MVNNSKPVARGGFMYPVLLHSFSTFVLPKLQLEVFGLDNLSSTNKSLIIISNHKSLLDVPVISSILSERRISWFTNHELYETKFYRKEFADMEKRLQKTYGNRIANYFCETLARLSVFSVSYAETIPVDRDDPSNRLNTLAIRQAIKKLEKGNHIGIFPEGGIIDKTKKLKLRGTLLMAQRCRKNILQVQLDYKEHSFRIFPIIHHYELFDENKKIKVDTNNLILSRLK